MIELRVVLPTRPGETASVGQALTTLTVSAQADRQCVRAQIAADAENQTTLMYAEEWLDEDSLAMRVRSERFSTLLSIMESCPIPPVLEFRFLSGVRGLDYVAEVRNVEGWRVS